MRDWPLAIALGSVLAVASPTFAAQEPAVSLARPSRAARTRTDQPLTVPVQPAAPASMSDTDAPRERNGFTRFVVDVGRDYKAWFTPETAHTLIVGTAATMFVRPADEELTARGFREVEEALSLGDEYGNLAFQVPLAVGWWGIGHTVSPKHAAAGRDLLRAQISAASWTYALKFAVNRTRPNGDPRSFPSGHSSATFAAATVLHRHYGLKMGVPFYALGVYTAVARIHDRKHWLSDTVMGSTVGIAAGRAVTFHLKQHPVHVTPALLRGGAMMQFAVGP
jgi:membrane-associated phospholipid phosphatase